MPYGMTVAARRAPGLLGQQGATSGQPGMQPLAQGLGMPQGIAGNGPSGGTNIPLAGLASGAAPTMMPQTGVTSTGYNPYTNPTAQPGLQGSPTPPGTFSQSQNLIGTQIDPTASGRLTNFQNTADSAVNQYAGLGSQQNIDALRQGMQSGLTSAQAAKAFEYKPLGGGGINMGAFGGGGPSAESSKLREMVMADLGKVREGSDRTKLAGDAFDLMAERSRPEFEQRVRQLGQNTAALGRIGSGIYGSNLTDLNAERERELSLSSRELANQAAGSTLADRLGILDATRGVSGDVSSQDANSAAMAMGADRDAYRRAADERDFAFNAQQYNNDLAFRRGGFEQDTARGIFGDEGQYDDRRFDQARSRAGDLSGYADSIAAGERSNRNETRGERDYQYQLSRDAEDDRYRQRGFEEDLVDRSFDRDIRQRSVEDALFGNQFDRSRQAYETGNRSNVPGQLNAQAGRYDQQAADAGDAMAQLLASYGIRNKKPTAATTQPQVYGGYYGDYA